MNVFWGIYEQSLLLVIKFNIDLINDMIILNLVTNIPHITEIFSQLYTRYKKLGFEIYGSYSPFLKLKRPSNYVVKKNKLMCTSGGITNDEMFIMYSIMSSLKPKNILIIGNGYGISTLFVSLILKNSKVIVIEKYRTEGITVTNKLLKGLKNKHIVKASTPEDLEKTIKKYFKNKLDMILVDAVHTNKVQTKEFEIYEKFLSSNSIVFFHDIISCNLFKSYHFLKKKYKNFYFVNLNKSSNGIGICLKKKTFKKFENFLNYFNTDSTKTSNFIKFVNNHEKLKKNNITNFYTPNHPQL